MSVLELPANRCEIRAVVGCQGTAYIFQHDEMRSSTRSPQPCHQFPEWPKGTGSISFQTGPPSGYRQVLTGEGRPSQVGSDWQVLYGERPHIGRLQFGVAPILAINATFLVVEVVGEQTTPFGAEPGANHPPASEELIERPHLRIPVLGSNGDRSLMYVSTASLTTQARETRFCLAILWRTSCTSAEKLIVVRTVLRSPVAVPAASIITATLLQLQVHHMSPQW